MELLGWYILFAVTTGSASVLEILNPVLEIISNNALEENIYEYKYISRFVFFLMATALAPMFIFACLIPDVGERARIGLLIGISAKD
jgi:hypothetical protein